MHDGSRPLPLATRFCLWLAAFLALAFAFALACAPRCACARHHGSQR